MLIQLGTKKVLAEVHMMGSKWFKKNNNKMAEMVMVKEELSRKVKLLLYWSIYVLILTCGHQRW